MSTRVYAGGWLQGKTVRKGGPLAQSSAHATRSSTPQIQSTSTTVFGGGVKDPSGRTSEFSVSLHTIILPNHISLSIHLVYG